MDDLGIRIGLAISINPRKPNKFYWVVLDWVLGLNPIHPILGLILGSTLHIRMRPVFLLKSVEKSSKTKLQIPRSFFLKIVFKKAQYK